MLAAGYASAESNGKMIAELIFAVGSTSFPSSHASTIVQLKGGNLMAAWFGGTYEGKPDVAIWASRHTSHGWSAPVELAREPDVPCWNPVLFHTGDGRLWLYYKFGPNVSEWTAARKYSDDAGQTWSQTEHLPAGIVGPVRAKPLVLADGTIVSGSSVESYLSWAAWIERSSDNGKTWEKIGPFVPARPRTQQPETAAEAEGHFGIIQPSVVSLGKSHLRFYARSTEQLARIYAADSFDSGRTWTQPHALDIPNPNSGIDAVALRDGRIVLVYNDTTHGRSPLNLAVSTDGEHFRMFSTLESQPGEYSYPAVIQATDGSLEITYTWNRKSIRHVHVPLFDIPKE
jgi:predicted neuraminidase